jgi:light-regulated signal transduction histidine kinase (bacteriophytochrome)
MSEQAQPQTQECFIPLHADSLHDLASPVNQIATMFELFLKRRKAKPPTEEDTVLNLIRESTSRLRNLIGALQDYDRLAGAISEPRSCESKALLAVALTSLDPVIRQSGAQVRQEELPRIHCDPNQMIFVFTSLIDNAIKFRGEDGPDVGVSAVGQGAEWLFSVRDNGIGIEARHRESVFHMFKRLNGERYPGWGAGLAITHQIVGRHGGRIWVESEPGNGSTFFFTLPRQNWQPACSS